MKEMFNRRQRFSLRKYSVGVCSVLLGTALFAVGAPTVAADEAGTSTDTSKEVASVQPESTQTAPDAATTAPTGTYAAPKVDLSNSTLATEAKAATEAPAVTSEKAEEAKPAVEATPKAEVAAKPATSEAGISLEEHAKLLETEKAAEAKPAATEAKPATDESNKPRVRSRRATTDHNSAPVSVETYLRDGETATPDMTNPNGATVSSQTVPSGYAAKEGDWYTYAVWDLTEFNNRYGTKYYARAYKRFDDSTDTTVELLDKNTGSVVETRTITASSGVQKFTTTTAASNSQLTFQVDYKAGTAPSGKIAEPFIQSGYAVGKSITDLVAAGHQLTPAEQKLFNDVYNARTTTDIINVVEPAYNGRTVTDSNAKIPVTINKQLTIK